MAQSHITIDALREQLRTQVGVSRWFHIDQPLIDAFAEVTQDRQFIHTDPERAATTLLGSTVAHGFLTLSLLSAMAEDAVPVLQGLHHSINYGFDKIRFISPVRPGAQVRGAFELAELATPNLHEVHLVWDVTVTQKGGDRPALAATWLQRHYLEET